MLTAARALKPKLSALRRAIHRQPELGFEVHKTAELAARTLAELGAEVQTGVGRTGVVGYLGEGEGPVIAIRADMDALPILEANQVEYASEVPGRMHACGHDSHTAMALGAAMLLAKLPLAGQVRLLFQPSEEMSDAEGVSGAPRMIEDGALKEVDAIVALHVDGALEVGNVRVDTGQIAGSDATFRATVRAAGGHGAMPHRAGDPIWMTAEVLSALYAIPSRRTNPFDPTVVSVGIVRGGMASNVIPDSVYIEGTVRAMTETVREQLLDEVRRALDLAKTMGGDYSLEIERGYPGLDNDDGVALVIRDAAEAMLGREALAGPRPSLGVEDFAYMTKLVPGAMFSLGTRTPGGPAKNVHTPEFDIDEDALPIGAAMLAEVVLRLLKERAK
jgi:amidohydrolase